MNHLKYQNDQWRQLFYNNKHFPFAELKMSTIVRHVFAMVLISQNYNADVILMYLRPQHIASSPSHTIFP